MLDPVTPAEAQTDSSFDVPPILFILVHVEEAGIPSIASTTNLIIHNSLCMFHVPSHCINSPLLSLG